MINFLIVTGVIAFLVLPMVFVLCACVVAGRTERQYEVQQDIILQDIIQQNLILQDNVLRIPQTKNTAGRSLHGQMQRMTGSSRF